MASPTIDRVTGSISLRIAVFGLLLVASGALLDWLLNAGYVAITNGGVWAGVTSLVGFYFTLLALIAFGVLEFLRISGY